MTERLKEVFTEELVNRWGDEDFAVVCRLIQGKSKENSFAR